MMTELLSVSPLPEFVAVILYSIIAPGMRFGLVLLTPSLITLEVLLIVILGKGISGFRQMSSICQ